MQQQWTISQSDSDMWWKVDFIQPPVMTSSVAGLRRSSKAVPKATLAPKKGQGHCLVVCCQSDPLQLSESRQNHYMWEVYSTNRWNVPKTAMPAACHWPTEWTQFFSMTTPTCMSHNQCFKSWVNWATKFCLIRHIQLTSWEPTTLLQASWQLFADKTLPQPAGCRKCFPRVHRILKHGFLGYRNKQTYFSLAKMCWL